MVLAFQNRFSVYKIISVVQSDDLICQTPQRVAEKINSGLLGHNLQQMTNDLCDAVLALIRHPDWVSQVVVELNSSSIPVASIRQCMSMATNDANRQHLSGAHEFDWVGTLAMIILTHQLDVRNAVALDNFAINSFIWIIEGCKQQGASVFIKYEGFSQVRFLKDYTTYPDKYADFIATFSEIKGLIDEREYQDLLNQNIPGFLEEVKRSAKDTLPYKRLAQYEHLSLVEELLVRLQSDVDTEKFEFQTNTPLRSEPIKRRAEGADQNTKRWKVENPPEMPPLEPLPVNNSVVPDAVAGYTVLEVNENFGVPLQFEATIVSSKPSHMGADRQVPAVIVDDTSDSVPMVGNDGVVASQYWATFLYLVETIDQGEVTAQKIRLIELLEPFESLPDTVSTATMRQLLNERRTDAQWGDLFTIFYWILDRNIPDDTTMRRHTFRQVMDSLLSGFHEAVDIECVLHTIDRLISARIGSLVTNEAYRITRILKQDLFETIFANIPTLDQQSVCFWVIRTFISRYAVAKKEFSFESGAFLDNQATNELLNRVLVVKAELAKQNSEVEYDNEFALGFFQFLVRYFPDSYIDRAIDQFANHPVGWLDIAICDHTDAPVTPTNQFLMERWGECKNRNTELDEPLRSLVPVLMADGNPQPPDGAHDILMRLVPTQSHSYKEDAHLSMWVCYVLHAAVVKWELKDIAKMCIDNKAFFFCNRSTMTLARFWWKSLQIACNDIISMLERPTPHQQWSDVSLNSAVFIDAASLGDDVAIINAMPRLDLIPIIENRDIRRVGLHNNHTQCYANSVFQILACEPIVEYLKSRTKQQIRQQFWDGRLEADLNPAQRDEANKKTDFAVKSIQLMIRFLEYLSSGDIRYLRSLVLNNDQVTDFVVVETIRLLLLRIASGNRGEIGAHQYTGMGHQCAMEFLEDFLGVIGSRPLIRAVRRNFAPVLLPDVKSETVVSDKAENPYTESVIPLPYDEKSRGGVSLQKLVDLYFIEQTLESECYLKIESTGWAYTKTALMLSEAPPFMVMSLRAFNMQDQEARSDIHSILSKHIWVTLSDGSQAQYEIIALNRHIGSLNAGHYIANVKIGSNTWAEMNDAQVAQVMPRQIQGEESFIEFDRQDQFKPYILVARLMSDPIKKENDSVKE